MGRSAFQHRQVIVMGLPFPGIGIVFSIDDLGGGFYGHRAWQIFMRNVDRRLLSGAILLEGDTALTLDGQRNEFCIGVYGLRVDVAGIRDTFEAADEPGLARMPRRIMEKSALDLQPLVNRARIDSVGRFVTAEWTRIDHDLCKHAGWGYAPDQISKDLASEVRAELESMMRIRV